MELRLVQEEIKAKLKEEKESRSRKVERKLQKKYMRNLEWNEEEAARRARAQQWGSGLTNCIYFIADSNLLLSLL